MSIDMYVGSSKSQATSVNEICQKQQQSYEQLQQAISQFVLSGELSGRTYNSAKQYFSSVLTPLVKGGLLLSEATAKACKRFPEEYQSKVDSADLKSSDLEEKIRMYQREIKNTDNLIQMASTSLLPELSKMLILNQLKNIRRTQEQAKEKLEKKLEKLLEFNSSSVSIFSDIEALEAAVKEGGQQAATCWNGNMGMFVLPTNDNMPWVKEISDCEKRLKESEYQYKLKQLEKYSVYAVPSRDPNGNPKITWVLEDKKTGKHILNTELDDFLQKYGTKLDPSMFEILSLDGFEEKIKNSWRNGIEYFSGKEYTGVQKLGMQGLQGLEDFAESEYADILRLVGFSYSTYKISTSTGTKNITVNNPKVKQVSNKKLKNATLANGQNPGMYKKASGLGKNIKNINPSEIRFSQTSVNGSDEIMASMKANGWKGDPIDVVRMPDGSLTTLDNTRVAAAREVGIGVQATVRNYEDLLPPDMVARFTTPKGIPKTWGEATDLRIGKQKASFRNNTPMGSFDLEKMK